MRFCEDRQCHIFVRLFNLNYDALYIALDKVQDFCIETLLRINEPDLIEHFMKIPWTALTRIAVPEALLQSDATLLSEIFDQFYLRELFIIVDPQPNLGDNIMKVQQQWELGGAQGRAFFWSHDRGSFEWGDGESIANETLLYRRIEEASGELSKKLIEDRARSFEIRPVFAVRK